MIQSHAGMPDDSSSQDLVSMQCHLCLRDIIYSKSDAVAMEKGFAICSHCDYHQPITKFPKSRDMSIFGATIAAVYFATIVTLIIVR